MTSKKIFEMTFSDLYPYYVAKAERKNRTKEEVNLIIMWLTGYDMESLIKQLDKKINVKAFFDESPKYNHNANYIKGVICGVRIEDIEDPLMKKIRCLDKLIDDLAKGKSLSKILRDYAIL